MPPRKKRAAKAAPAAAAAGTAASKKAAPKKKQNEPAPPYECHPSGFGSLSIAGARAWVEAVRAEGKSYSNNFVSSFYLSRKQQTESDMPRHIDLRAVESCVDECARPFGECRFDDVQSLLAAVTRELLPPVLLQIVTAYAGTFCAGAARDTNNSSPLGPATGLLVMNWGRHMMGKPYFADTHFLVHRTHTVQRAQDAANNWMSSDGGYYISSIYHRAPPLGASASAKSVSTEIDDDAHDQTFDALRIGGWIASVSCHNRNSACSF